MIGLYNTLLILVLFQHVQYLLMTKFCAFHLMLNTKDLFKRGCLFDCHQYCLNFLNRNHSSSYHRSLCQQTMMATLTTIILITTLQQSMAFLQMHTTYRAPYNEKLDSNTHELEVSNCTYKVLNGFLKEKCLINKTEWFFKCSHSNRFYKVRRSNCKRTLFSRVCPNDTTFYQACGHQRCARGSAAGSKRKLGIDSESFFGPGVAACGYLICQWDSRGDSLMLVEPYGELVRSFGFDCQGDRENRCVNYINDGTLVHKYVCDRKSNLDSQGTSLHRNSSSYLNEIHKKSFCDKHCDNFNCEDEAFCHNMTIGLYCQDMQYSQDTIYVPANQICDGNPNCYSHVDENNCRSFKETCMTLNTFLLQNSGQLIKPVSRFLSPQAKCSYPSLIIKEKVCIDYKDQMNCTGSTISPLLCKVNGYPTTISEYVVCQGKGLGLCDDQIDNECIEAETECIIHKHKLCDGFKDCRGGHDEGNSFCFEKLSYQEIYCVRKLSRDNVARKLPDKWVLDGVSDCRNNVDEKTEDWKKLCGFGLINYYVYLSDEKENCSQATQFKCPLSPKLLNLDRVCSGNAMDNCDAEVCTTARKEFRVNINDKLTDMRSDSGAKRTFYCLPGLHELETYAGSCTEMQFPGRRKVVGIPDILVLSSQKFAVSYIKCSETFGDLYVYLMCSGLCGKSVYDCPLKSTAGLGTCLNYPNGKTVLSIGDDGRLVLATVKRNNIFSQELFLCDNGHCITFDKVCNVVDDCGDLSDEKSCFNNFKCNDSREYIPLTSKCDKKFDCFDYSDECNDECDNQITMFDHVSYKVIAWIFGVSATALNAITLLHGFSQYRELKSDTAMINKIFVILITFGDLLQGVFLLVLSIGEQFFNKSTCVTQFEWTTSDLCTFLGVLSTVGSLVSLYSMTILSIIRASKINSMVPPKETLSRKRTLWLSLIVITIIIVSTFISVIPVISFEDFFVEKLIYDDNPLLVGAPDKVKHLKITESYFGRIRGTFTQEAVFWRKIRDLISELFANNKVTGRSIDFYGSNGFCLFSYFVRKETTYKWFSIIILGLNFLCVLIIVVSYIVITVVSLKTSRSVSNSQAEKNNKKLQRKITIIIMTDILTWLPFIVICIVNYTELVDTSSWYSLFCVFFLRINCIINPIGIYDESIFRFLKSLALMSKSRISGVWLFLKNFLNHKEIMNQNAQVIEMVEMPEHLKRQ